MTIDPAFALLIAIPIVLLAIAAAIAARPGRLAAALMAGCAVLALVVGCGKPSVQSQTTSNTSTAAISPVASSAAPAARIAAFTASELSAARHAKPSGMISVDIFDTRPGGAHQDAVTLSSHDTLYVIGWAYLEPLKALCGAVGLLVDGKQVYPGAYGYARADVATFYKEPARTNVGYAITVPAARLGRGSHKVTVVCAAPHGVATSNAQPLAVTVK